MLININPVASPDEILTVKGEKYEAVIIDQSPSDITIRLKERVIIINRSDLKYIKKWPRAKNNAMLEDWKDAELPLRDQDKKKEELRHADYARYSKEPWEIYEEETFIVFHNSLGLVNGRLKGKVKGYCERIKDKLACDSFKFYDKNTAPDWDLKIKIYVYRNFQDWQKALEDDGRAPNTIAFIPCSNRRACFYGTALNEEAVYHEMAHLIYKESTSYTMTPGWWDEGVAAFACATPEQEKSYISKSKFRAKNNQQIPLSSESKAYEHVYVDGLSVISFLIREKGRDRFKEFNRKLKDGTQFERLLPEVYGFKDVDALDRAWIAYLKNMTL